MLELSDNIVCAELMVDASVEHSHSHAVHANVVPEQDEEGVAHDSEAHLAEGVATVLEVALEQVELAEVQDRVVLAQFVVWDAILG